jgi:hypothetical protein
MVPAESNKQGVLDPRSTSALKSEKGHGRSKVDNKESETKGDDLRRDVEMGIQRASGS